MKYRKFTPSYDTSRIDEPNTDIHYHFFAANGIEWATSVDFADLYRRFSSQKEPFYMYFVKAHARAEYQIINGAPAYVDVHYLGEYE